MVDQMADTKVGWMVVWWAEVLVAKKDYEMVELRVYLSAAWLVIVLVV